MAHKFAVSPATKKLMDELTNALTNEMQEHRDAWEERSEKWQQGDAGVNADAWLDGFEQVLDALEAFEDEPDA